ncbi:7078_t:CDS:2 [Diversispora eburnea]|uniref:7078_t:CDS:1 n=1 Tax=Diversispora eburnea TaxID=1213867 RepID=A0A9N8YLT2_9GLOM|nr:7078_t:CDS:2 [Diversispora eburnea]
MSKLKSNKKLKKTSTNKNKTNEKNNEKTKEKINEYKTKNNKIMDSTVNENTIKKPNCRPGRLVRVGKTWVRINNNNLSVISLHEELSKLPVSSSKTVTLLHEENTNNNNDKNEKGLILNVENVINENNLNKEKNVINYYSLSTKLSDNIISKQLKGKGREVECKLSQNTFLPVGYQLAEEIFSYLEVEDLVSVSLTYKPIYKFITLSTNLWKNLYKQFVSIKINKIMEPLTMLQTLTNNNLKPSIAWKNHVFSRIKYRPIYLSYTYLDSSNDFMITFPGASYDYDTIYTEVQEYVIDEDEPTSSSNCNSPNFNSRPPQYINNRIRRGNQVLFDEIQNGFQDQWRIAIEKVKCEMISPLKLKDGDDIFVVYNYSDTKKHPYTFEILKIFDNINEAIKFAKEMSDELDGGDVKNVEHRGEIFDSKRKNIFLEINESNELRVSVDKVKFWKKVHKIPNFLHYDNENGKDKIIETWKQMGYVDKSFLLEALQNIVDTSSPSILEDLSLSVDKNKRFKIREEKLEKI